MKKSKKTLALVLAMTVTLNAFTFISANASQGENLINVEEVDETHPLVDISSIIVDNTEVTQGDIVNLRLKILGDPQYIKQMEVAYEKPTGGLYWTHMEYNKDSGYYEGVREISEYSIPGNWRVYRIEITYTDDTFYCINIEDEEINGGSYTIFGTDGDVNIPILDESTLSVSEDIVYEGDRIWISVKASDDKSGIYSIGVIYREPEYKDIELNYNAEKDIYEGYIDIDENTVLGDWKISQIYMEDNEQNYIYINNNESGTTDNDKDLSGGDFTVIENNSLIDLRTVMVDKSEVVSGESVKLSFKLNEEISKVKSVTAIYNKGLTGHWKWMSMEYNFDTGYFEGYKSISDYTEEGLWTIDQIHIEYNDGTEVYIANINDPDYNEGEDLSGGNFNVIETDSDIEPPVLDISSIELSSKKARIGDKIWISLKASDDKSGIDNISVIYREPEYKSISLSYNSEKDVYEGYIDIDENTVLGDWKISQIYMEDNEENYIYINNNENGTADNDKDLSSGTFTVYENDEKPVINGVDEVILRVGDKFNSMEGVTAYDAEDGDLTANIIVTDNVNTYIRGDYTLIYTVTDSYGNTTTEERIVRVTLGIEDLNGDGKIDILEFFKWLLSIKELNN